MIAGFYKDCEIFMTGGSGVVGKSTIDKLLRSCDVKKIYILLRSKKDQSVEQRLDKIKKSKVCKFLIFVLKTTLMCFREITSNKIVPKIKNGLLVTLLQIFRMLQTQKPDELNKLIAIPGDAALPKLGITEHYAKMLENVKIFFHCAATVRFDEDLRVAIKLNVGGTWEALKFAESLKKLKIFMHCSTFFSNPYLKRVTAKLYPSPMDWKFCLDLVQDDAKQDLLDTLTKKLIVGFPNTYCFTKNLAESLVYGYHDRVPVAIYRPSIVLFALREPEPGFPSALMGAMGLFVLVGVGMLKIAYMKQDIALDITPLDLGANLMIINAYLAAKQYESGKLIDVPISMCSSYGSTQQTFNELASFLQDKNVWYDLSFEKCFLIPHVYMTSSKYVYNVMNFIYQILPSMFGDGVLMLFGRKPVLVGIVRRYFTALEIMRPFVFNNYESDGITHLEQIVELTRGTDFNLDAMELVNTHEGLHKSCINMVSKIREVVLNEDESSIERSKKVLIVKKVLYNVMRMFFAYFLLRWFFGIMSSYLAFS